MDVTASTGVPGVMPSTGWRHVLPPVSIGLLLLGIIFNREVTAAVQTWSESTAYNHCFLVIPIAVYLYWDRRRDVTSIPAQPFPAALLLGLPIAAAWLVSERLGIMEGRQLAVISFFEILFLAALGKRLWWALAGPLLYLYFLVPFGEFLTPKLQDVTTWFIRHGMETLGVPTYIDGYVIEIPQGTFFVAEACAGLRFLIASVAFGCLYMLLMYRSPWRRLGFVLASIIVPVIANGFRGIGIVYLGYTLGSAQAAAADHIIYGWLFFSAVTLLLIALGLPFREDQFSPNPPMARSPEPITPMPGIDARIPAASMRTAFALTLGIVLLAAVSPAVAYRLSSTASATTLAMPSHIALRGDCLVQPAPAAPRALPPAPGALIHSERVLCGAVPMALSWAALSPRSTAGPVMALRRRIVAGAMTENLQESWLAAPDGTATAWRVMTSTEPTYAIAVSTWIDGKPVRPGLAMRLRMALSSLTGSAYAPMVVTVTPMVDWKSQNLPAFRAAEEALTGFLQAHPELDQAVGTLSALP